MERLKIFLRGVYSSGFLLVGEQSSALELGIKERAIRDEDIVFLSVRFREDAGHLLSKTAHGYCVFIPP